MGLFNWVAVRVACASCGEMNEGFQTKDGDVGCITVPVESVANFYTQCRGCRKWIEYTRAPAVTDSPVLYRTLDATALAAMGFREGGE